MDTFRDYKNRFISEMDCINIISSITELKLDIQKLKRQHIYEQNLEIDNLSNVRSSVQPMNYLAQQRIEEEEKEMIPRGKDNEKESSKLTSLNKVGLLILTKDVSVEFDKRN
jgi:hypothetical protein